ncbi:hypothetical protein BDR26DRAFT_934552 [Obelidium mucronatum]|nr:hypothetical protein BDR26DRAFT_934552 [Obelidium mucronatum]
MDRTGGGEARCNKPIHSDSGNLKTAAMQQVEGATAATVTLKKDKTLDVCTSVVLNNDGTTLSHAWFVMDPVKYTAVRHHLARLSNFRQSTKHRNGMELLCMWRKADIHYNASITKPNVSVKQATLSSNYFSLEGHLNPELAECIPGLWPLVEETQYACKVFMGQKQQNALDLFKRKLPGLLKTSSLASQPILQLADSALKASGLIWMCPTTLILLELWCLFTLAAVLRGEYFQHCTSLIQKLGSI